jgi:type IV pilus assembly protein PilB
VFELKTFAPGQPIIAEGVHEAGLYILQSGAVEIWKNGLKLAEISEPGTFFGEIAAILNQPRSCTVKARSECDILVLQETIDHIIEHNPRLARRLLEAMAERVVKATADLAASQHTLIAFQEGLIPSQKVGNS